MHLLGLRVQRIVLARLNCLIHISLPLLLELSISQSELMIRWVLSPTLLREKWEWAWLYRGAHHHISRLSLQIIAQCPITRQHNGIRLLAIGARAEIGSVRCTPMVVYWVRIFRNFSLTLLLFDLTDESFKKVAVLTTLWEAISTLTESLSHVLNLFLHLI